MSQTIVGSCPRCGAPIYAESPFFNDTATTEIYTCSSRRQAG
jgi:hypothetical protein